MDRSLRTIVVGIADIEGPDPHLEPAIRLAEQVGATLFVVHAFRLPDPLLYPYLEMGVFSPELVKGMHEAVQAKLAAQVAKLSPRGRVHCRTVPVPADAAIVEVAEKEKADLILVGATQRGTLSRTVLGTTAQRVVRAAAVPVLVNRRPGHGAVRRVLMTTDLTDLSASVYKRGRAVVEAMATEDDDMVLSRQKYGSTDISGNYAEFARAMGGYGERVTEPDQVLHALVRGIRMTQ